MNWFENGEGLYDVCNVIIVMMKDKEIGLKNIELFEEFLGDVENENDYIKLWYVRNYDDGNNNGEGKIYYIGVDYESMCSGKVNIVSGLDEGLKIKEIELKSVEDFKKWFIGDFKGYMDIE